MSPAARNAWFRTLGQLALVLLAGLVLGLLIGQPWPTPTVACATGVSLQTAVAMEQKFPVTLRVLNPDSGSIETAEHQRILEDLVEFFFQCPGLGQGYTEMK